MGMTLLRPQRLANPNGLEDDSLRQRAATDIYWNYKSIRRLCGKWYWELRPVSPPSYGGLEFLHFLRWKVLQDSLEFIVSRVIPEAAAFWRSLNWIRIRASHSYSPVSNFDPKPSKYARANSPVEESCQWEKSRHTALSRGFLLKRHSKQFGMNPSFIKCWNDVMVSR